MQDESKSYSWEWPLVLGVFFILLGIFAIAIPIIATVSIAFLLGIVFLLSGVAQFIHAIRFAKERGRFSRFLLAALAIAAGVIMIRNPIAGAVGITLAMAFYFLVSAAGKGTLAFEHSFGKERGWFILGSILSLILGVYLIVTLPFSSLIVPGVFLGIDLIFFGCTLFAIAGAVRKLEKSSQEKPGIETKEIRRAG